MRKRRQRVIVDTNIWIHFLLTKKYADFDLILRRQKVILLFSRELLEEFLTVAIRPSLRRYFKPNDLLGLLHHIHIHAEFVDISTAVAVSRDPKDDFLLSLALDGHADFLITGDADLLILKHFEGTRILKYSEFLRRQ